MRDWLDQAIRRFCLMASVIVIAVSFLATCGLPVSAASQGDGTLVYGEGTVTTPRNRTWTQSSTSWSNEASNPAAAATIRHVITKASPVRDEVIVGVQTTGGALYIQRWDGSSWSAQWNVTVGNGNMPRFDIAYESNSGEAVVVYSRNVATTNELVYRRWNGTSWTSATNLDAVRTTGAVHAVQLQSHAGTLNDDMILAWGDANLDLSANYWVGSSNSWAGEPSAALSTGLAVVGTATTLTTRSFDVALESNSGDALVVWGNNAVLDLRYITRTPGAGGTWGTATTETAAPEEPTDLELVSDPLSDYMAYANISDNGADAGASTWSGTGWNSFSNFDTTVDTVAAGTKNIAVAWLSAAGQSRAVITYDDTNNAGIDWLFYNKNTNAWSGLQADYTGTPAPSAVNDFMHRMVSNPFDPGEAMVLVIDSNSDLFAKRLVFDGTNFTWSSTEGAAALEATVSVTNGRAADFAYARYVPGTLGVDIVDGTGMPVGSPSVTMTPADVSLDCQQITGTFGNSAQRVRVANNTTTPGWSLTIAATSGGTAIWNSGGSQYDFNDSSGAPAGCSDGADGDAHAGQLSMNPSTGTLAPQSGCTNTGVTLGSSASFAQGTLDSLTIASASGSAGTNCSWDITGIEVMQQIPAEKGAGNYSIDLTLTVTAN